MLNVMHLTHNKYVISLTSIQFHNVITPNLDPLSLSTMDLPWIELDRKQDMQCLPECLILQT